MNKRNEYNSLNIKNGIRITKHAECLKDHNGFKEGAYYKFVKINDVWTYNNKSVDMKYFY